MKVETTNMTKDEQKQYDKTIATLRQSKLFNTLYTTLEESENVYSIGFGKTDKDQNGNIAPGCFKPDSETDGGSITFLKGTKLVGSATAEEFVHAYQNENKTLENPNINSEFEAKTITHLIQGDLGGYGMVAGMSQYQSYLNSEFPNGLTPKDIYSTQFQSKYQVSANLYAAYNQSVGKGNPNYRQLTLQQPVTLMRLCNNTFFKYMPWLR